MPELTAETAAMGTLRILEAVRISEWPIGFRPDGSSSMFSSLLESPQRDTTHPRPRSRSAVSKVLANLMTVHCREACGLRTNDGILLSHESPRRRGTFVTRKVTRSAAAILSGKQDHLFLGNLDVNRDWRYAKDYFEAMWLTPQQSALADKVITIGEMHSVQGPCEVADGPLGLDWERYARIRRQVVSADGGQETLRRYVEGPRAPRLAPEFEDCLTDEHGSSTTYAKPESETAREAIGATMSGIAGNATTAKHEDLSREIIDEAVVPRAQRDHAGTGRPEARERKRYGASNRAQTFSRAVR
jgi:hypothetical protein